MSSPIPISTPPNPASMDKLPPSSSTSPSASSAASTSPRTPFLAAPPNTSTLGVSPTGSNIIRWASSFGAKSPSSGGGALPTIPAGAPIAPEVFDANDDAHEHHDSFEFGDFAHSKDKSWTGHARRAMSMSLPSGHSGPGATAAAGGGGITSMLTGFGSTAPLSPPVGEGQLGATVGSPLGSSFGMGGMPQGGVLADKAAKAQGVMRRLSIGSGFKPAFLSPTSPSQPLASPPKAPVMPQPAKDPLPQPKGADTLQPPSFARGRRFSESGGAKKRGVSPMGERMLREHGHF